jgi:hypothetical protein
LALREQLDEHKEIPALVSAYRCVGEGDGAAPEEFDGVGLEWLSRSGSR